MKTSKIFMALMLIPTVSFAKSPLFSMKEGDGFKRFSISAGWLHVMPQGKTNPIRVTTPIQEKTRVKVGEVSVDSVKTSIDTSTDEGKKQYAKFESILGVGEFFQLIKNGVLPANLSGESEINGLSQWTAADTGLEPQDVDTLGIMSKYQFTDNWALEMKGGIPPKVDIKGKGKIYSPMRGTAFPSDTSKFFGLGEMPLKKDIFITDLSAQDVVSTARAWTPAFELQYQFGKSGVNKFRPYLGVGVMYAYFNELKTHPAVQADLIASGHMVQNILDNKAGASLDKKTSSANPKIKVKADDAFAPIVTAGFTYDITPSWFAVASVSYAKLSNDISIDVVNQNNGQVLNHATTTIDTDPLLTYMGIGYRY
ncbi:OmpW family protein [Acinetobacter wuhouensis]|uniref:OmpW family protein n=1 Tax=Acinetobacter wuhouensis TaxID=1879050 RepID=A0A385C3B9_9GAMM|nr:MULTISPECIES: OmpW family outer membrane protein [Acinetobacter]AXQ21736.1 OmpW family protein [Acinetobacter wuhouensis]AYO53814.1 OmpW family protein [Acinetobacter wuhouensis]RZG46733.1 OmpW family protein [Acinetobacter wuhouensis]RZG71695.1 OmpW family protein [Acinetobacter wuhouensis]RZG76312.1 OmpW family protein [Acinetobacter sp. WCHAc060025]